MKPGSPSTIRKGPDPSATYDIESEQMQYVDTSNYKHPEEVYDIKQVQ